MSFSLLNCDVILSDAIDLVGVVHSLSSEDFSRFQRKTVFSY